MNGFFWTFNHLGWGFFSLVVFTGMWFLFTDLVWRMKSIRVGRLIVAMSTVWIIGAALVLLGFYLGNW